MEETHSIFDIMRLANKFSLDTNDWLTIREIAEARQITVEELLTELGRAEQDGLQGIEKTND